MKQWGEMKEMLNRYRWMAAMPILLLAATGILECRVRPQHSGTAGVAPAGSPAGKADYPRSVAEALTQYEQQHGGPLDLTIDTRLQGAVESAFETADKPGAAVVVDARSGAVLALHQVSGLVTDPLWQATCPGSTVKAFLALAVLHEGVVRPDETIECTGTYPVEETSFSCFNTHGPLDLSLALVTSCNLYFYEMAHRLGIDRLALHYGQFGVGQPTGIELPGETVGVLPDRQWWTKNEVEYRDRYALIVGIGHGPMVMTPLQLARAYAGVATGKLPRLTLLEKTQTADDTSPIELPYSNEHRAAVTQALRSVVDHEQGTGQRAKVNEFGIAGKTGTAEFGGSWEFEAQPDNGWFAGYGPAIDPQIVVVVFVEGGQNGGQSAAPIAGQIFRMWHSITQ